MGSLRILCDVSRNTLTSAVRSSGHGMRSCLYITIFLYYGKRRQHGSGEN